MTYELRYLMENSMIFLKKRLFFLAKIAHRTTICFFNFIVIADIFHRFTDQKVVLCACDNLQDSIDI